MQKESQVLVRHQRRTCGGGSGGVCAAEEQRLYGAPNCGGEEDVDHWPGPVRVELFFLFLLCFGESC